MYRRFLEVVFICSLISIGEKCFCQPDTVLQVDSIGSQLKEEIVLKGKSNIFLEFMGNVGFGSVNYERYFTSQLSGRIGIGLNGGTHDIEPQGSSTNDLFFTPAITLMTDYLLFDIVEVGAGVTALLYPSRKCEVNHFRNIDDECSSYWFTSKVGFRLFPPVRGFTFAACYVFDINVEPVAGQSWFGISGGYIF